MTIFLFADSLNYAATPKALHNELLKRSGEKFKVLDVGRFDLTTLKNKIDQAKTILLDNSIILAINTKDLFQRDFYLLNRKPPAFYIDLWSLIKKTDKPVFLFAPMSDLHSKNFGLERDLFTDMLEKFTGIFWQFYRFPLIMEKEADRYSYKTLEPYGLVKEDLDIIWREITGKVKINIDLPNCIAENEVSAGTRRKKYDFVVPGAGYITRQIALQNAKESNIKNIAPYRLYHRWLVNAPYYFYSRFLNETNKVKKFQHYSLKLYRHLISSSTTAFVCGSELCYNVRKFWEVPAWRTAMLAYPTRSLGHYGFQTGLHYLECFPEETGEKIKYLLSNKPFTDKLVLNAWNMIREKHTASARADQVLQCLDHFEKGKLNDACFKDGNFEIF